MPIEGGPGVGYVVGTGTFTASGNGAAVPLVRAGLFNVTLSGTWAGTVTPQRSLDGTTWFPVTYNDGTALSWTAPISTPLPEAERGALFRLACTWTSGTVVWRVGQ
jgi:hypothetical protein